MNLLTEYLVIIDKESNGSLYTLCDNVDVFMKLLSTDTDIFFDEKLLTYKNELKVEYRITTNEVKGKSQRFFYIKIIFDSDESKLPIFERLLRCIRGEVYRIGAQPETLWDDVSKYYAVKAYPLIHKIENLMRKLITYFMLTNVGRDWVKETSPKGVIDAIENSKRKQYLDILHRIDFNHLGDFLFKPYQLKDTNDLLQLITKAQAITDLDLEELKTYTAKSNWERYFSNIVDCTNEFLIKRWKDLYDLRCSVAHNALVSKEDFERITNLIADIEPYLEKAIANIDKVHVPPTEKEQVTENVLININTNFRDFIQKWRFFEKTLSSLANDIGILKVKHYPWKNILMQLMKNNMIDEELFNESNRLIDFRNLLIHQVHTEINESEIQNWIFAIEKISRSLQRSWKDEIIRSLIQLGGEANLTEIYDYVEKHSTRELPSTWKATVRKTLQLHCSETDTYKGGEDIFVRVRRGRWALKIKPN